MTTRPTLPRPTFVQAPAAYQYPRDGEIDAWAEWQARLDASAHERPIDPAVEASIRAADAIFCRRVADQRRG